MHNIAVFYSCLMDPGMEFFLKLLEYKLQI